jgi:hypothetical protein
MGQVAAARLELALDLVREPQQTQKQPEVRDDLAAAKTKQPWWWGDRWG